MTAPIEANKSAPAPPTKSVGSFAMNPNILMNHKIKGESCYSLISGGFIPEKLANIVRAHDDDSCD